METVAELLYCAASNQVLAVANSEIIVDRAVCKNSVDDVKESKDQIADTPLRERHCKAPIID